MKAEKTTETPTREITYKPTTPARGHTRGGLFKNQHKMKKFKVTIRLGTGDKIHALVEAKHKNEAKSRLLASQQYQEFVEGKEVVAIEIEHAAVEAQDNEKYIIKAIDNMHGWCCCIDTETTLRVEWRKGEYNEKQRSSFRTPPATALEAATAERQMADFLLKFFPELL